MTLPDLHWSYHVVRAALELVSFLASVGVLYVAFRGLEQVKSAVEQVEIAKREIATRVHREAAKETAAQLDVWATDVIPTMDALTAAELAVAVEHHSVSMERYDLEELTDSEPAHRIHQKNVVELLKANSAIKALTVKSCNLVEASAMCFMTGVADEQIAFMSLSRTFCNFVERTYSYYCGLRHKDQLNQFEYTIRLYRVWSQRRAKHELDATQQKLSQAMDKAAKEAAPVHVIGHR